MGNPAATGGATDSAAAAPPAPSDPPRQRLPPRQPESTSAPPAGRTPQVLAVGAQDRPRARRRHRDRHRHRPGRADHPPGRRIRLAHGGIRARGHWPAAAPAVPPAPPPPSGDYDEIPLTRIQQVSATRLTESKQQAPHIYLTSAIDVTELLAFRVQINATLEAAGKGKVSVNDLLVKAVASTLRTDPSVNVSFAGDKLLQHKGIHLGVAVATPAGLLVPVIRDADRKSVSEIAAESRDKAERARDRKLRAEEMWGGTFTLSNLGMFGIEQFTAVINPPESAILAVGGASDELRLEDGRVVTRKILRVTLSADHRAIDGAVAAKFLEQLKDLLEQPLRIVT